MIDYVAMLKEFHTKYGHYISDKPAIPLGPIRELRNQLINEEVNAELFPAIDDGDLVLYGKITAEDNLVAIADALADSLYVIFGTALSYGIPIDEVFTEVHRSNMTKSMLKDTKSVKGKTLKGNDFEPVDIRSIIQKYMS